MYTKYFSGAQASWVLSKQLRYRVEIAQGHIYIYIYMCIYTYTYMHIYYIYTYNIFRRAGALGLVRVVAQQRPNYAGPYLCIYPYIDMHMHIHMHIHIHIYTHTYIQDIFLRRAGELGPAQVIERQRPNYEGPAAAYRDQSRHRDSPPAR